MSCEAVPAFMPLAGAVMGRHVRPGNHAAEGFVSFILFGGPPRPSPAWAVLHLA
jgi:hypothetical protein